MLSWIEVFKFAATDNPKPDRKVGKTDDEWRALLTPEQYRVTRCHGTECAFSSEMCESLEKVESNEARATFGGGCFWCTEAVFQRIKGVIDVKSGYSGGEVVNPTYREVCSGRTGHAEVIEVAYDPAEVSFKDIFCVHLGTHDPTTLNRQGADSGTQYRSVIFYRNEEEKQTALDLIEEYETALGKTIVTEVKPFAAFFAAEPEHQNYYNENSDRNPYCDVAIVPKLAKFRAAFPEFLKE